MRKQPAPETVFTPLVSGCAGMPGILLVGPDEEDAVSLEQITDFAWTLVRCASAHRALAVLRTSSIPILLWDADLTSSRWQEMLERIALLSDPPLLIVTSRVADDYLWAEALNLGAWDVLAKPFDPEETSRVLGFAWRHWQDRHGIYTTDTMQRKAATGT
jgi:DNA-binding response OmpR family regulator